MIRKKSFSIVRNSVTLFLFLLLAVVGCVPTSAPGVEPFVTQPTEQADPVTPNQPVHTVEPIMGCADGGEGIFTPEDVRCYLAAVDPQFVREIDGETAVLFTDPNSIADWVGGAIIYHIPTISTLVLDRVGDVDPQFSNFTSRAGAAALSELAADPLLMATLQQEVQQNWQTTTPNEPTIRLSTAWQDGSTTVFLVAIAGLAKDDTRFYCAGEAWTIGDITVEILSDCMAPDEDAFVSHVFFSPQEVKGNAEQTVQVALNGVPSNVVMVSEGALAVETAVYQTLIQYTRSSFVIIRGETIPAPLGTESQLATTIEQDLLQTFLSINQAPQSLRFLFQGSNTIYLQPGIVVDLDYLFATNPEADCERFHNEYPSLSGVTSFSQIAYSADNTKALVFMNHKCGPFSQSPSYFQLDQQDGKWQITQEIPWILPVLIPDLTYTDSANGCGDIFVYKSNSNSSEFITFYIAASEFTLSAEPTTFDLAQLNDKAEARIDVFADAVQNLGEFPYCNDVGPTAVPTSEWQAVSGTATITISESANTEPCVGEPYQATVKLEDVTFGNGTETMFLESVEFNNVTVGWCAG